MLNIEENNVMELHVEEQQIKNINKKNNGYITIIVRAGVPTSQLR